MPTISPRSISGRSSTLRVASCQSGQASKCVETDRWKAGRAASSPASCTGAAKAGASDRCNIIQVQVATPPAIATAMSEAAKAHWRGTAGSGPRRRIFSHFSSAFRISFHHE